MLVRSRDLAGKFNPINGRVTDNFLSDSVLHVSILMASQGYLTVWDHRVCDLVVLWRN